MVLEIIILTEVSERKTNIMASLICGILKNDTNELTFKTEIDADLENKLNVYQRGKSRGGMNYNGNNIHALLYTQAYCTVRGPLLNSL